MRKKKNKKEMEEKTNGHRIYDCKTCCWQDKNVLFAKGIRQSVYVEEDTSCEAIRCDINLYWKRDKNIAVPVGASAADAADGVGNGAGFFMNDSFINMRESLSLTY